LQFKPAFGLHKRCLYPELDDDGRYHCGVKCGESPIDSLLGFARRACTGINIFLRRVPPAACEMGRLWAVHAFINYRDIGLWEREWGRWRRRRRRRDYHPRYNGRNLHDHSDRYFRRDQLYRRNCGANGSVALLESLPMVWHVPMNRRRQLRAGLRHCLLLATTEIPAESKWTVTIFVH